MSSEVARSRQKRQARLTRGRCQRRTIPSKPSESPASTRATSEASSLPSLMPSLPALDARRSRGVAFFRQVRKCNLSIGGRVSFVEPTEVNDAQYDGLLAPLPVPDRHRRGRLHLCQRGPLDRHPIPGAAGARPPPPLEHPGPDGGRG